MFYYYGAKNQLIKRYPAPVYDTIIQPFAGSASYAQHYATKNHRVILYEKDDRIVMLWHTLQKMTAKQIRELPCPPTGHRFEPNSFEDMLVKVCATSNSVLRMAGALKVPARTEGTWPMMMNRMADRVGRVKHWEVVCGDYREAPKILATWAIDPPYQTPAESDSAAWFPKGKGYKFNCDDIDFGELRSWVIDLPGQIIVCEQRGADWLDGFEHLNHSGDSQGKLHEEVVATWDNHGQSPERYMQTHSKSDEWLRNAPAFDLLFPTKR